MRLCRRCGSRPLTSPRTRPSQRPAPGGGRLTARRSRPLARRALISSKAFFFCVLVRSGGSFYLPKTWIYLTKHPSPRSSCHSSKLSKQTNQTTQAALLRQERAREHRTALRSCPSSAARGARPAQDPGGYHHHAGPSQPRRHCALSSTAKPAPKPLTCGCSTALCHHVQSRVQKQSTGAPPARLKHRTTPRDKKEARQRAEQHAAK